MLLRLLDVPLGLEARHVAVNGGDGKDAPAPLVGHRRVLRAEAAVDRDFVPLLGVPDVVDADVVVLAPEERDGVETFAHSEHVLRGHLTLALGDHPVLHANPIAGMRIGPARDVARREHPWRAGLQVLVHCQALVRREARLLGPRDRRPHADARDDEIGFDGLPVAQRHLASVDTIDLCAQMEHHAVALVQRPDELAHLRAHDALERLAFGRNDVHVDPARAQ